MFGVVIESPIDSIADEIELYLTLKLRAQSPFTLPSLTPNHSHNKCTSTWTETRGIHTLFRVAKLKLDNGSVIANDLLRCDGCDTMISRSSSFNRPRAEP